MEYLLNYNIHSLLHYLLGHTNINDLMIDLKGDGVQVGVIILFSCNNQNKPYGWLNYYVLLRNVLSILNHTIFQLVDNIIYAYQEYSNVRCASHSKNVSKWVP